MKVRGILLALVGIALPLAALTGYGQNPALPASMVKMKSGECRFTVLGPDGIKPLEGVQISIVPVNGSASEVSTATDASGVCGFNIDEGEYVISLNDRQIALLQTTPAETITDYRFVVPSESLIMETSAAAESVAETAGAGETVVETAAVAEATEISEAAAMEAAAAEAAAAEAAAADAVAAESAAAAGTTTSGEEGVGVITTLLSKEVAIGILVVGGLAGGAIAIENNNDDDDDPPRVRAPAVPVAAAPASSRRSDRADTTPAPAPKPVTPPVTSP